MPTHTTPQEATPIVYVVDDDQAVRRSLTWLIESVGLKVQTFGSAQEVMDQMDPERVGCMVIDVRMPGSSGLELQQWLREKRMQIPVIIITGHADVPMAVRAMKSGAVDFVEKPFSDQVLLDRIQEALAQDRRNRMAKAESGEVEACLASLTPRERQVMDLVVEGRANRQVAQELGLSEKTVEAHRAHMMTKMRVNSVAELVRAVMIARDA
jgi:RNA polymerase sigma factor (sigma-70 family)